MSVILGATYPDRFSAIVVGAGLEYARRDEPRRRVDGAARRRARPGEAGGAAPRRRWRRWRGRCACSSCTASSDAIVAPVNGDQVAAQWRATDAMLGAAMPASADGNELGQVAGGRSYTTTRWGSWVQKLTVDGMGHAWSGGDAGASYTDPKGPDASELAWQFFANGSVAGSGGGNGGGGGGSNGGGGGSGGVPSAMMHGGCSVAGAHVPPAGSGFGGLLALGLLAARKRATSSAWIRCSDSPSSSRARVTPCHDATAMTLSTVGSDGRPSARVVLLKGVDDGGFVFYTNTRSRKGRELAADPAVALTMWWPHIGSAGPRRGRRGRASATPRPTPTSRRARAGRSSARGRRSSRTRSASRDGARRASSPSSPRASPAARAAPAALDRLSRDAAMIEFWKNRDDRLHEREEYRRDSPSAPWTTRLLNP